VRTGALSAPATTAPTAAAWRFFDTRVAAVTRLSPSFVRLTLTGSDLATFADNGRDQRFKLVLPDGHGSYDRLPRGPEWHAAWRRLQVHQRNPIRTYTVRAVRPGSREVDVDMVLHGDRGPGLRFVARAAVGDPLVVLGPSAECDGPHGGAEFRPPPGQSPIVLVGDATATPAVLSIVAGLPADTVGEAVLEVPYAGDVTDVRVPRDFPTWLVQQGPESGLPAAVDAALDRLDVVHAADGGAPLREPERDEPLWDVPEQVTSHGLYAWIAGESSLVAGLRRHLVRDLGVDRWSVAFMGYWRAGRLGS
jgi:NADPH-dependent ferric siderophore reductase